MPVGAFLGISRYLTWPTNLDAESKFRGWADLNPLSCSSYLCNFTSSECSALWELGNQAVSYHLLFVMSSGQRPSFSPASAKRSAQEISRPRRRQGPHRERGLNRRSRSIRRSSSSSGGRRRGCFGGLGPVRMDEPLAEPVRLGHPVAARLQRQPRIPGCRGRYQCGVVSLKPSIFSPASGLILVSLLVQPGT